MNDIPPSRPVRPDPGLVCPRADDCATVYLKNVVSHPRITIGDFTIYNDPLRDPREFERQNVLYLEPEATDRLVIGRFCSIACGAKFLLNGGSHALGSLSIYPFPFLAEQWPVAMEPREAFDDRGDIVVGNDVWIGFEAVVMAGVRIGNGAIIGSRALVTRDVPDYAIVGGVPARPIKYRFPEATVRELLELAWWDWPVERIAAHIGAIRGGDLATLRRGSGGYTSCP